MDSQKPQKNLKPSSGEGAGRLAQPVDTLKSIGPQKLKQLENLRIHTIEDLLRHYPRDYEDRSRLETIAEARLDTPVLICAQILSRVMGRYSKGRKSAFRLLVGDETGKAEIVFFHMNYGERIFQNDELFFFYGKITDNHGKRQMIHPDFTKVSEETGDAEGIGILPVYPLTAGISANDLRKWNRYAMAALEGMPEYLPPATVSRSRLCDGAYALQNIHFPKDFQTLQIARYRLIFEEFLLLQTGLLLIKNSLQAEKKGICFQEDSSIASFVKGVPFPLTGAQLRTIDEIEKDMCSEKIMNRLVQGDVGSGKTIVAAAAIFKCVQSGYQAVMMAPTEILARQHYDSLCELFQGFALKLGFLTGSLPAKDKRQVLNELAEGKLSLLIGTHAIIQPGVVFKHLGLVVTDEQHRFGVKQRAALAGKGGNPDMLVMTATPIPRTLALILYGDLDISLIDEMPPGRREIITYSVGPGKRKGAYEFMEKELQAGRQAYVVAPLIEDSSAMEGVRSAQSISEELRGLFPQYRVALLHGELRQKEKDEIMADFKAGAIHILVATVVIEVGVNVPNASVMVIENAERFGLAQLHQLRGRVGRGAYQSYCILISQPDSQEAKERALIMKKSADGFVIAEKDLQLRGPGEFFGTRQHGVPELKIANLARHMKILRAVQQEAALIFAEDPFLEKEENQPLLLRTREMFQHAGGLGL